MKKLLMLVLGLFIFSACQPSDYNKQVGIVLKAVTWEENIANVSVQVIGPEENIANITVSCVEKFAEQTPPYTVLDTHIIDYTPEGDSPLHSFYNLTCNYENANVSTEGAYIEIQYDDKYKTIQHACSFFNLYNFFSDRGNANELCPSENEYN